MASAPSPKDVTAISPKNTEASALDLDNLPEFDTIVDQDVYEQLAEMDEDGDRSFSFSIVENFFEQAVTTFTEIDVAFETGDLDKISSLGHYLKGSSAAIGIARVRDECEKLQHLGKLHDEAGVEEISQTEAKDQLKKVIAQVKKDYAVAEAVLRAYYAEEGVAATAGKEDQGDEDEE